MNTLKYRSYLLTLMSALLLAACGGGSGGGSLALGGSDGGDTGGANQDSGKVQIILTDAEEDFLSYKIDVVSITLTSVGGTEVDVLTTTTEVDFVQYQELSELFAVRSIPAGNYDSIQLELDYSSSEIIVQDEFGTPFIAAPVDSDGAAITSLNVNLQFGDAETVIVSPARVASLTLDLDLSASNTILSFAPAEVLVEPFLMASVETEAQREHRARGLLQSVDVLADSFVIDLLPMRLRDGSFGEVTLTANTDTAYEINGVEFTGTDGLTALEALALDTPVVAYGAYDEVSESPLVTLVYAGTSVPWDNKDVLRGTVTARTDDSLTVAGGVIETSDGSLYARFITLDVDEDTLVTGYRLGDADIDSLSIGQTVQALGTFTQTSGDAETSDIAGTFDATGTAEGAVQMRISSIVGSVETAVPLTMDLGIINRRPIDIFDFTGTGSSALVDADPANYEVDTGSLNIANIEANEWILVRGYPTAFGAAPEDFEAVSITDPESDSFNSSLTARWEEDAAETIIVDGNSFSLNLEEGGSQLRVGRIPAGLSGGFELSSVTGSVEDGRFAVQISGESITIFTSYTDFLVELTNQLNLSEARQLTARGEYNSIDGVLTAGSIVVRF
jgi:hypothetical protein